MGQTKKVTFPLQFSIIKDEDGKSTYCIEVLFNNEHTMILYFSSLAELQEHFKEWMPGFIKYCIKEFYKSK